ncbi:MAG: threonylcarbamoyl-AMP synthase [Paramuribaculum sp.]|nr:threonylcarbamoyl-AMP synthase [Paramuribaculum sp.]
MKCVKIYPSSINDRFIAEAVNELSAGNIIIYPTDSVYALGCNALSMPAIEKLCQAKGINPLKETLSITCADISQASEYARIDNRAFRILKANLPGAFTFVLPAATSLPKAFKGRRTVGIRVPDNSIAVALAAELGNPIMTTSLPLMDGVSPEDFVRPESIAMIMDGKASLMIDGGEGGMVPSTIVDLTDSASPEILRQGLAQLSL